MGKEQSVAEGLLLTTATLADLELFRGEAAESLDWVLDSCAVQSLTPGEVLLDPNDDNDTLYIILAGRAEVRFSDSESCSSVYLGTGECVGEMSVIEGGRPSATVVADAHCQVLVIDAEILWALIDRSPVVARNLLYILSTRVRRNNLALVQSHVQQRIHERDALSDSLTGLHNRRWMARTLGRIVEHCRRAVHPLALFIIDTDSFKRYNDDHGHLAGDQLLITIARGITESVRSTDHVCRYGGDEFVVVLPQASPAEAMQIAERVCRSVREKASRLGDGQVAASASVSVGVASLEGEMTVQQLLANADAALYRAKAAGRGGPSR